MSLSEYLNNSIKNYYTIKENNNEEKVQPLEDIKTVERLLDQDADVHALNRQTPLDVAIDINNEEAVKLLLRRGVHVGRDFDLLICNTINKGNVSIVKLLVDYGLQNDLVMNPRKCLDVAIEKGHLKIIDYIIPHCELKKVSDRQFTKSAVLKSGQQYRDCINLLFKHGFVVSPRYKKSCDFVYPAVENGHTLIIKELLKLGTDVNMLNQKTKLNLLHVAVLRQHSDIVKLLIDYKADVNAIIAKKKWLLKDEQLFGKITKLGGKTALHIAVDNADIMITKLLLDNGAKIEEDPNFFNTASDAVRRGCKKIVEIFLKYGVHVNDADTYGKTLLHHCTMYDSLSFDNNLKCEIAKLLLKNGANINAQSQEGNTPIFDAIVNGNTKIFKILLKYNADIQHTNTDGDTLLHKAFENIIDAEIIKILLKHNAEVNATNKKGWTPLHVACQKGLEKDLTTIEKFLHHKADINCVDKNKRTPLHFACDRTCTPIVQVLLEHHAAVNLVDEDGCSPLHLVCKKIDLEIIENLLKNEANPNVQDKNGKTPLANVCEGLKEWIPGTIENLVGLQTNIQNLKTVIDKYQRNIEIVQLLLDYNADVHIVDNEGKSLLHHVVGNNYLDIVKVLFKYNIDINVVDIKGQAALHYASENGYLAIVKNLLIHGADVNILSNNHKTAVHHALIGSSQVQRALKNYLKNPEEKFHGKAVPADYEDDHTKSYRKIIRTFKEIIKILKEHIIKLKCAKLSVNQKNVALAYDEEEKDGSTCNLDPYEFKYICEKEIAQLKLQNIEGNNITFYDLLTNNTHSLAKYANNKSILKSLILAEHCKKFPLYIDIIIFRFIEGTQRHDLLEVAKKYSLPSIFQGLPYNYVDEVLGYLSISDLKIFVNVVKTISDSGKLGTSKAMNFINKYEGIFDSQPYKKRKIF